MSKLKKHEKWIEPYLLENENIFIGWIRHSDYSIKKLEELGVYGPMKWNIINGCVEKCIVTREIGQKLKRLGVLMDTFTETDSNGKQVSVGGQGL